LEEKMKKNFLLIVLLLVAGFAVVTAQDMAKLQQLQQEVERIEMAAKARGGNYTPQEQQRLVQIQQEMIQAMGPLGGMVPQGTPNSGGSANTDRQAADIERRVQEAETRNAQNQQDPILGNSRGWPAASVFRRYGVTINQPSTNTTVSYTLNGEDLTIYFQFMRGSDGRMPLYQTMVQTGNTIERHLEAAVGRLRDENGYLPDPQNRTTRDNYYYIVAGVDTSNTSKGYQPYISITFAPGHTVRTYEK
jgi:hypothetical protein